MPASRHPRNRCNVSIAIISSPFRLSCIHNGLKPLLRGCAKKQTLSQKQKRDAIYDVYVSDDQREITTDPNARRDVSRSGNFRNFVATVSISAISAETESQPMKISLSEFSPENIIVPEIDFNAKQSITTSWQKVAQLDLDETTVYDPGTPLAVEGHFNIAQKLLDAAQLGANLTDLSDYSVNDFLAGLEENGYGEFSDEDYALLNAFMTDDHAASLGWPYQDESFGVEEIAGMLRSGALQYEKFGDSISEVWVDMLSWHTEYLRIDDNGADQQWYTEDDDFRLLDFGYLFFIAAGDFDTAGNEVIDKDNFIAAYETFYGDKYGSVPWQIADPDSATIESHLTAEEVWERFTNFGPDTGYAEFSTYTVGGETIERMTLLDDLVTTVYGEYAGLPEVLRIFFGVQTEQLLALDGMVDVEFRLKPFELIDYDDIDVIFNIGGPEESDDPGRTDGPEVIPPIRNPIEDPNA